MAKLIVLDAVIRANYLNRAARKEGNTFISFLSEHEWNLGHAG